jgi:hypothetical protein
LQLAKTYGLRHSHCRAFGFVGDGSFSIAAFRQLMSCIRRSDTLNFAASHRAEFRRHLWIASERSQAMAEFDGFRANSLPVAKLCCQSSTQRTEFPIASASKLSCCRASQR